MDLAAVLPLGRQHSLLNIINVLMQKLGHLIPVYLPKVLQILLCIAASASAILDRRNQVRSARWFLLASVGHLFADLDVRSDSCGPAALALWRTWGDLAFWGFRTSSTTLTPIASARRRSMPCFRPSSGLRSVLRWIFWLLFHSSKRLRFNLTFFDVQVCRLSKESTYSPTPLLKLIHVWCKNARSVFIF